MTDILTSQDLYRLRDVWASCPLTARPSDRKLVRMGYLAKTDFQAGEAMPGMKTIYDKQGSILPHLKNLL